MRMVLTLLLFVDIYNLIWKHMYIYLEMELDNYAI